jgi:glycosyltransferase involved in cell wall biosynthesis
MRIALVSPPFIAVPPKVYGGTELFIAQLAEGLQELGLDVVVYCNGESTVGVERRWIYEKSQWPIKEEVYASLKDINHTAWAIRDALETCDVIHINNLPGLVHSRFIHTPFVYTMHHPHEDGLTDFYRYYPEVHYVTISDFQRRHEPMPKIRTIHHGINTDVYELREKRDPYLVFLGRIAPIKGTHLAIEVARKSGVPLKIAGEVQPMFRDYFDTVIRPKIDGKFIEYVGEADLAAKNELLGGAMAMLFPIQWNEPFGLVMVEAMACGTPVLALPGGAVEEVLQDGVSGFVCDSVDELVARVNDVSRLIPAQVRAYAVQHFSIERMVREYASLYSEITLGLAKPAPMVEISSTSEEEKQEPRGAMA